MKLKLIPFLFFLCLNATAQEEQKLADAFIQSLAKNNYGLLSPHIATADILNKAFYGGKANKAKLAKDFVTYTTKLKSNWPKYNANAKTESVDISKIKILDVSTQVINKESNMHGLNIMFKHADRFGTIGLIYFPYNKKSYLLDFPNPLTAFNSKDSFRLAAEIQLAKDKNDPTIKAKIKNKIDTLLNYIEYKFTEGFTANTVYRGDDASRRWKAPRDSSNKEEMQEAREVMQKMNRVLFECSDKKFSSFNLEKESEGVWYVYTYQCSGGEKIHLAFLKINDDYLLGDIETEKQ